MTSSRFCWALRRDGQPCRRTPARGAALCHAHAHIGVPAWGGPMDGGHLRPSTDGATVARVVVGEDGALGFQSPDTKPRAGQRVVGWYQLADARSGLWSRGLRYRWYEGVRPPWSVAESPGRYRTDGA